MKSATLGYTFIEVLIVVAVATVLIGIAATYRISDTGLRLAELEFEEYYRIAKNLLIHAHSLHVQGFRYVGDLNTEQLKAATQGSDWEKTVRQIAGITDGHDKDDFKMRFNEYAVQVIFLAADELELVAYPVQKRRIAGSKDEVVLTRAVQLKRSRNLRVNDYLTN